MTDHETTSPPGSSGGPINRSAERQSPARKCGGGEPLDVPQADNALAAGGRGHHTPHPHATPCEGTSQGGCTIHDAAPAARATEPESSVPLGSGVAPAESGEPNVLENQRKATDCEYERGVDCGERTDAR